MYSYVARRLVFGALTIVGVSIMVFVVMRILPGDPLVAIFGAEGMTKLIVEPGTGRVLGAGMVGPGAGELIAQPAGVAGPLAIAAPAPYRAFHWFVLQPAR